MRRWFAFAIVVWSIGLVAPSGVAAGVSGSSPRVAGFIPPYAAASSHEGAVLLEIEPMHARENAHGRIAWSPTLSRVSAFDEAAPSSKKKYLPVLYSLLVPGAGEISMGRWKRGVVLVAAEVTAWSGHTVYNSRGLDSRRAFEAFADRYWNYNRWIDNHALWDDLQIGGPRTYARLDSLGRGPWDDNPNNWPGYHPYAAKPDGKENYYENIGKYDWFISGWEDWDPLASPRPHDTALRDEYRSMRRKSNKELNDADRFVYLSIAARVISLVETVWMVQTSGAAGGASRNDDRNFRLSTRSTGLYSGEVALEYRFR